MKSADGWMESNQGGGFREPLPADALPEAERPDDPRDATPAKIQGYGSHDYH